MKIIEDRTPIDELLEDQQRLRTPVMDFSNYHDRVSASNVEPTYRELIPLSRPGAGEQYAFEVDLDSCTGCKACVTGCHSMNGLEAHETWRDVGLIHGRDGRPFQQTVTSACHHCVEPACMHGCPVLAYEKDQSTGVVVHLDDQCIGCQYCVLKCPYDVPKYSEFLGIVRKCDMCHGRLRESEAPACVQACPTSAIRITIVDTSNTRRLAAKGDFLPGVPAPGYTVPTTRYVSKRSLPADAVAADREALVPQPAHFPLVFMLVFTQMALGCFLFARIETSASLVTAGFISLLVGIASSVLHLGRPLGAWRAFLGLKRSWLSREIVVFGGLVAVGACHLLTAYVPVAGISTYTGPITLLLAVAGVYCSVMIYADTRRAFWSIKWSGIRFFGTALVLGSACWMLATRFSQTAACLLLTICLLKLGLESVQLFAGIPGKEGDGCKSARLMTGRLFGKTRTRYLMGILGGVVIPLSVMGQSLEPENLHALSVLSWFLLLVGELFERTLFFQAVVAPKMPGGVSR